jgi:type I restriction enzyme S subunit
MRSGEGGIGKVAISDEDVNAIFCDFIIRFRFNKDLINPKFAYYYFRSQYFQYMIEINKKGLGNNTNIFPNNLQDFPIPNISIEEQKGIVYEIDKELKQQREIINSIETIMKRMDRLICSFI